MRKPEAGPPPPQERTDNGVLLLSDEQKEMAAVIDQLFPEGGKAIVARKMMIALCMTGEFMTIRDLIQAIGKNSDGNPFSPTSFYKAVILIQARLADNPDCGLTLAEAEKTSKRQLDFSSKTQPEKAFKLEYRLR